MTHVPGRMMHGGHGRHDGHGGHGGHCGQRGADEALVEFCKELRPGTALDLGAGYGRNSLWLARNGWAVVAVDRFEEGLAALATEAPKPGVRLETVESDIDTYLAQPLRFDLVVMANLHPEPPVLRRWLQGASAALAPGGHLFVAGHHVASLGLAGPPSAERLYTEESLAGALSGLETLRMEVRQRVGHSDTRAPLDLVAWAVKTPASGDRP